MWAARHCPQFANMQNKQLTRQHVGGPVNASVFWTGCHSHIITKTSSEEDISNVGCTRMLEKLKSATSGFAKVIPRAAPSVEVLSPRCNAPEIPKPLKASMLQGFFFKATSDSLRWHQTFNSCNWGPNMHLSTTTDNSWSLRAQRPYFGIGKNKKTKKRRALSLFFQPFPFDRSLITHLLANWGRRCWLASPISLYLTIASTNKDCHTQWFFGLIVQHACFFLNKKDLLQKFWVGSWNTRSSLQFL